MRTRKHEIQVNLRSTVDREERFRKGERVSWMGIWGNVALTIFKALAGILGRSQAMVADATHSLSDIATTTFVLLSLKISKKPVDETHPYGHGKIEAIAAGLVGSLLGAAGVAILLSAIRSISVGVSRIPGAIALVAAITSIVVKEGMFQYTARVGRKLHSPAVMASAWHHRSDALSSVAALVGIGGARLGYPILDPLAGAGVSLFIIKMGYDITVESFHHIMDTAPGENILRRITGIAEEVEGVEHVHEIKARRMGQYLLVDLKLEVDPKITVATGHTIASEVRHKIMGEMDNVADVMVHVNPYKRHPPHGHPGTSD